jgi:hypothetical protein
VNYEKDIFDFCGGGRAVVGCVGKQERRICQVAGTPFLL